MEHLLDIKGLAAYLDVPEGWVEEKVTARAIPFTRIGKHVRFATHHIEAIIAAGEQPVESAPSRLAAVEAMASVQRKRRTS